MLQKCGFTAALPAPNLGSCYNYNSLIPKPHLYTTSWCCFKKKSQPSLQLSSSSLFSSSFLRFLQRVITAKQQCVTGLPGVSASTSQHYVWWFEKHWANLPCAGQHLFCASKLIEKNKQSNPLIYIYTSVRIYNMPTTLEVNPVALGSDAPPRWPN